MKKKIKQNCLNETLAQIHMLIQSSMLNYKLNIHAKIWGNKLGGDRHVNRLSAHNRYKHRSAYTLIEN